MLTVDLACDRFVRWWVDSKVFQALVVAMTMIVVDVFSNGTAKRALPKEDHLTQAFGFDAAEKAFDERNGGAEEWRSGGVEEWSQRVAAAGFTWRLAS